MFPEYIGLVCHCIGESWYSTRGGGTTLGYQFGDPGIGNDNSSDKNCKLEFKIKKLRHFNFFDFYCFLKMFLKQPLGCSNSFGLIGREFKVTRFFNIK